MKLIALVAFALVTLASGAALAEDAAVVRVESKYVCMINDTLFPREQIPVAVGGKTYFGCCEMCKERLASQPEARKAVDPVTGKEVDKASAAIGAKADGKVLYFENQGSLERYVKDQSKL
jgi:YHS domain-containing protein